MAKPHKKHFLAVDLVEDAMLGQALPSYLDLRGTSMEASKEAPSHFCRSCRPGNEGKSRSDFRAPPTRLNILDSGDEPCMEVG
jgi:hypothetical protein